MKHQISDLLKAIKAERLKMKGLGLVWLGVIIGLFIPLASFIFMLFKESLRNYDGLPTSAVERYILNSYQGYGTFFLLLYLIIATTRICQTDHKNKSWMLLETQPISKLALYLGKLVNLMWLSLVSVLTFFISAIVLAYVSNLLFPNELLSNHLDMGWVVNSFLRLYVMTFGVIAFQLMLSMMISGFVWPFIIGLVGMISNVFMGVFGVLFGKSNVNYFVYNNVATALGIKDPDTLNHYFNYTEYLSLLWWGLFTLIGYLWYQHRSWKQGFIEGTKTKLRTVAIVLVGVGLYWVITQPRQPQRLQDKTMVYGQLESSTLAKDITIRDKELGREIAKVSVDKVGRFQWETSQPIPFGAYVLNFDKKSIPITISTGDKIELHIQYDDKNIKVNEKGTRKADNEMLSKGANDFSYFYDVFYEDKKTEIKPEEFYEEAQKEWTQQWQQLEDYTTNENIPLSDDAKQYLKQLYAARMLNTIHDFQTMRNLTGLKSEPPKAFYQALQNAMAKPMERLATSEIYQDYLLNEILKHTPVTKDTNLDSLKLVQLSTMAPSLQKDRLLTRQLINSMKLEYKEEVRNQLFSRFSGQFKNADYRNYVANELHNINSQQRGKPFPKLKLETVDGKLVDLSIYKDKYVVIDFWATWCAPCRTLRPTYEYKAKKNRRSDVVFISISVDDNANKWKMDIKGHPSDIPQYRLLNKEALSTLDFSYIPRLMLLSPGLKIYNAKMPTPDETNFDDVLYDLEQR